MLITYNGARNRYEAQTTYAERATANPALKAAGFSFDFDSARIWHSQAYPNKPQRTMEQQTAVAAHLLQYCDEAAKAQMALYPAAAQAAEAAIAQKQESLEQSRATDLEIDLPRPEGLNYLPYQRAGIAYAMKRQHTLIADEMGLGKTIQAIGIANADETMRRILIICPASLKLNWAREWRKWDIKHLSVGIVQGRTGELPTTDVLIVNYDIVEKRAAQILAINFDLMIVDECHSLKNPKAKRTQYILGKKANSRTKTAAIQPLTARRRVFLTGTPIVNRPVELWPLVESLDKNGLGANFFAYAKRYCNAVQGRWGWDFTGSSNLSELQEKLRSTFMVRRLKSEVLKDLPAKRRQVIILEPEGDRNLEALIAREKAAYAAFDKMGLKTDTVAFTEMSLARKAVAVAKVPFVIEHLTETLEEVDKVVVMAHHHEVVDALAAHFGSAAVIVDGRTAQEDRQVAVDRFQSDPTCRVFIGTIKAAGVGLTLTAASTVIFAELDWVPGNVTQAEDRCHRLGQTDAVLVQHLVLDESLDARMVEIIIEKQAVIDAALDNEIQLSMKMPEVGYKKAEPKATEALAEKLRLAGLTAEQIDAIHMGLRMLAGMCDGAQEIDGMGFNKFDTNFGKTLAACSNLTIKQALAGQKLVRKYQKQLNPELVQTALGVQSTNEVKA